MFPVIFFFFIFLFDFLFYDQFKKYYPIVHKIPWNLEIICFIILQLLLNKIWCKKKRIINNDLLKIEWKQKFFKWISVRWKNYPWNIQKKNLVDFYSYYILICITKISYILLLFIVYIYFCFLNLKILDLIGYILDYSIQWIAIKISFNECLIYSNKVIRWYSKSIKGKNYIKTKKLRETNGYKFFQWNWEVKIFTYFIQIHLTYLKYLCE